MSDQSRADGATVAALGVLAAVTVVVAHEAVGHGSACLALGGEVTLVSTALSRCSTPSNLIDLGGPLMNLTIGAAAMVASRFAKGAALRLYLVLVAAFAGFWEGAYLVKAMLGQDGDLYFFLRGVIGEPPELVRNACALLGAGLYGATVVLAWRGLTSVAGTDAPRVGRIVWAAAAIATIGAALLYRGGLGLNLRDTALEIAAASAPLLWTTVRGEAVVGRPRRRPVLIGAAIVVCAVFCLTMGRGIGA